MFFQIEKIIQNQALFPVSNYGFGRCCKALGGVLKLMMIKV